MRFGQVTVYIPLSRASTGRQVGYLGVLTCHMPQMQPFHVDLCLFPLIRHHMHRGPVLVLMFIDWARVACIPLPGRACERVWMCCAAQ